MHIAVNNLRTPEPAQKQEVKKPKAKSKKDQEADVKIGRIRQRNYEAACTKYADRIAEIQKYFPGWMPDKPGVNDEHE